MADPKDLIFGVEDPLAQLKAKMADDPSLAVRREAAQRIAPPEFDPDVELEEIKQRRQALRVDEPNKSVLADFVSETRANPDIDRMTPQQTRALGQWWNAHGRLSASDYSPALRHKYGSTAFALNKANQMQRMLTKGERLLEHARVTDPAAYEANKAGMQKNFDEARDLIKHHRKEVRAALLDPELAELIGGQDTLRFVSDAEDEARLLASAAADPAKFREDRLAAHRQRQMAAMEAELAELPTLPKEAPSPPAKPSSGFKKFLQKLPFGLKSGLKMLPFGVGAGVGGVLLPDEVQAAYERGERKYPGGGDHEAALTLGVELARMGDPGYELAATIAGLYPKAAKEIMRTVVAKKYRQIPPEKSAEFARGDYVGPTDVGEAYRDVGPTE